VRALRYRVGRTVPADATRVRTGRRWIKGLAEGDRLGRPALGTDVVPSVPRPCGRRGDEGALTCRTSRPSPAGPWPPSARRRAARRRSRRRPPLPRAPRRRRPTGRRRRRRRPDPARHPLDRAPGLPALALPRRARLAPGAAAFLLGCHERGLPRGSSARPSPPTIAARPVTDHHAERAAPSRACRGCRPDRIKCPVMGRERDSGTAWAHTGQGSINRQAEGPDHH
jgi:hypothetical protein